MGITRNSMKNCVHDDAMAHGGNCGLSRKTGSSALHATSRLTIEVALLALSYFRRQMVVVVSNSRLRG